MRAEDKLFYQSWSADMTHLKSSTKDQMTLKPSSKEPTVLPQSITLDRRSAIKLSGSACAVSALGGCVIAKKKNPPDLGASFSFDLFRFSFLYQQLNRA